MERLHITGATMAFDKKGQLGGFEISTLKVESGTLDNGGLFSAESFGSNANGGDSIPPQD